MIKTKLFDNRSEQTMDTLVNGFLDEGNRKLIDIKLMSVEESQFTQCEYIAILIYEEGYTDKETIEILGDAAKDLIQQNKHYRTEIRTAVGRFNQDKHREGMRVLQGLLEGESDD